MLRRFLSRHLSVGEVATATGRALVEERYSALRRQIPIIYLIAVVNLSGVELATAGKIEIGINVPTILAICAAIRIVQWWRVPHPLPPEAKLRRLRQTGWLAVAICLIVGWWCLQLSLANPDSVMAVMLFGSLTALGVSYGLSPLPFAARLPLLVLALPLAIVGFLSSDPQSVGASLSIGVVSLLMLRLLLVNNAHFTALIRSRSIIVRQRQAAESARREALVAATTDFLTGLPNRRAFVSALESHLRMRAEGECFAVGILDLDRFKVINDTFGHATGDKLLQIVSERLLDSAGPDALVARLGGDEFGLVLPGVGRAPVARTRTIKILAEVNRPAIVDGRRFAISACCGIAVARPRHDHAPSRLLAEADLALYEAKDDAAGGVAVFEQWMETPRRRRAQIERALQLPGVNERIDLVFQPIIDLATGKVIANEALARWTDEELGEISPSEFVPVAEQLNLIGSLSDHLMVKAFAEATRWPSSIRLSFNLSAIHLCAPDSAANLLAALKKAGLATSRLQVEVTETALLRDFDRANENLGLLRDSGVTIVLDDFGAGYASIAYLRELRFDQIKLDGGLLSAALESADGERLLRAVIGLCHALGVETVAEHVESERHLELLSKLRCTAAQGFWLHKPMTPDDCCTFSQAAHAVVPETICSGRSAA